MPSFYLFKPSRNYEELNPIYLFRTYATVKARTTVNPEIKKIENLNGKSPNSSAIRNVTTIHLVNLRIYLKGTVNV